MSLLQLTGGFDTAQALCERLLLPYPDLTPRSDKGRHFPNLAVVVERVLSLTGGMIPTGPEVIAAFQRTTPFKSETGTGRNGTWIPLDALEAHWYAELDPDRSLIKNYSPFFFLALLSHTTGTFLWYHRPHIDSILQLLKSRKAQRDTMSESPQPTCARITTLAQWKHFFHPTTGVFRSPSTEGQTIEHLDIDLRYIDHEYDDTYPKDPKAFQDQDRTPSPGIHLPLVSRLTLRLWGVYTRE